jgi:AraC-like DNA-binding protein
MKNEFTNVKINRAYHRVTPRCFNIRARADRALVIRLNKRLDYSVGGERIETVRGDALFIPKGASYTTHNRSDDNEYIIVNFSSDENGFWEVMHVDDIGEARAVHSELCRAIVFDDRKSRMRALSLFYRLLSLISEGRGSEEYLSERKLDMIRPALDYVENNIFSPALKMGELHTLCNISDVYFRKIFTTYTGSSPQSYVTEKRLERAREIIDEGAFGRVRDVALAVGYTDALYFSRIFKKRFGYAPSASPEVLIGEVET